MHLPDWLFLAARDRRVRLAVAVVAALTWYVVIVTVDIGRTSLPFLYGVPAVLVLLWWRTRPLVAFVLSFTCFTLVLWGAGNSTSAGAAAILACGTIWLAIVGAFMSHGPAPRWTSAAAVFVYAVVSLLNSGAASGFAVVSLGSTAGLAGWAWRQAARRAALDHRLVESTERGEAAEQDVLVELERNRLAREVHDVVAHSLAVVIAQADGARFAAETKPESVAPALEAISDTARRALGEVRTMLHDLRTSGEGGVVPGADDLQGLIEGVRGLGVQVDGSVFGDPQPLDRAPGLALYRVAQEALTNAMRHGDRGEPVGFELDWGDRQVVLVITNAVPSEAVPSSERAGHGLTGMRERAADAGGDCSAGVGSNGRFRVRVVLPVAAPEQPAAVAEPVRNPLLALFGDGAPARG